VLLPDDLRQRLAAEIERLRPHAAAVAWVAPANLHVTLKFLGQVDEARAPASSSSPAQSTRGRVGEGNAPSPRRARSNAR
jgi:2'-5' RNA ligase